MKLYFFPQTEYNHLLFIRKIIDADFQKIKLSRHRTPQLIVKFQTVRRMIICFVNKKSHRTNWYSESKMDNTTLYHERQVRELCAVHALNNLFQGEFKENPRVLN